MSASQLADDSTLPGAGNNNNGGIDDHAARQRGQRHRRQEQFPAVVRPRLDRPGCSEWQLRQPGINRDATTGSGGYGMVGSTATILAGTNSSGSAQTVNMSWRTQTIGEGLFSDVLDVGGMALSGSSGQTAPFVLQMTYNPGLILSAEPYLGWLNPTTDSWQNAVLGNYGSSNDYFVGIGAWNGDTTLGDYGVNTANDTVWAVVDHNSQYAVVPEPSTLTHLAAAGVVGFVAYGWRRRQRLARESTRPTQDEADSGILSFPTQWAESARRAA